MACTSPLKAFKVGINPETGKDALLVCSYSTDHIEVINGQIVKCSTPFLSTKREKVYRDWIEIPCGHCDSCRMAYARNWALRCMLELKSHDLEKCWFVTLTYDEKHLSQLVEGVCGFHSVEKRDLQLFWKRLRDALNYKYRRRAKSKGRPYIDPPLPPLKYFACGEYGPTTLRPHYHAIVYDLPLDDLKPYGRSHTGYMMYESAFLSKVWNKGLVRVQPVSFEACAYTARYVMKKQADGDKDVMIEEYGLYPEFLIMSRNPGIAAKYYESRAPDIYKNDEIYLNGQKFKPPPYFDRRFEIEDPERLKEVKEKRKEIAIENKRLMLEQTDLTYEQILKNKELVAKNKAKILRRTQL